MGKRKKWKHDIEDILSGFTAKNSWSDESGDEFNPDFTADEMADTDLGPPNEEIQAEVAPPVTPSFSEASPPTPKKIDIPEPLEEPQFDCSPPLAEEIQAGGALSMGIHSNGDAPSTGKSPVEERDNVASPDAKPSEEKESGKKTHSAVRLDICNISEDMLGIHTMWALRREGNLLVYDEDKGYFSRYTSDDAYAFLRSVYRDTDIDIQLRESSAKAIFKRLLAEPSIQSDINSFDREQPFVNVKNGVVDLQTGCLLPHDPKYKFTSSLQGKFLTSPHTPPKNFDTFVERNFSAEEDALLFRQVMFYVLSWMRSAKLAFYLEGKKDTGKSVIAKLLCRFIGGENVSLLKLPQLLGRWGASGIVHSRLNICTEVERETLTRGSELKGLISLDPQACEFKGKDFFTFIPRTCFMLIGNGMLKIDPRVADPALLERFLFLKAQNPVPKGAWDTELLEKFWGERDAILTELIEVGIEWLRGGMQFAQTEVSAMMAREFKHPSGSLIDYIEEKYVFCPAGRVWTRDIYDGFVAWRKLNGFLGDVKSKEFQDAMNIIAQEHGLDHRKIRIPGRKGICIGYIGLKPRASE